MVASPAGPRYARRQCPGCLVNHTEPRGLSHCGGSFAPTSALRAGSGTASLCSTRPGPAEDPAGGWPLAAGWCRLLPGLQEGHLGQDRGAWGIGCSKPPATVLSLLCGWDSLHGAGAGLTAGWGHTAGRQGPMLARRLGERHLPKSRVPGLRAQGARATLTSILPLPQARSHRCPQTQVWPCLPILSSRTGTGTAPPPHPGPISAAQYAGSEGTAATGASSRPCCLPSPGPQPSSPRPPGAARAGERG